MIIKPVIYTKNIPDNPLLEVLVEKEIGRYEIIWFHWKFDGPSLELGKMRLEDYEPIIIIYCNDSLRLVLTRSSWNFKHYNIEDELTEPLSVLFQDSFHHYIVKTEENSELFEKLLQIRNLNEENYDDKIREIVPSDIPSMFRSGLGHPTNGFVVPRKDPAIVAREYHEEYCE